MLGCLLNVAVHSCKRDCMTDGHTTKIRNLSGTIRKSWPFCRQCCSSIRPWPNPPKSLLLGPIAICVHCHGWVARSAVLLQSSRSHVIIVKSNSTWVANNPRENACCKCQLFHGHQWLSEKEGLASIVVPALAAVLLIFFSSNHQAKTAASPRTRTVPAADFATTVAAALYYWPNIILVNYMWDSLSVNNFVYI